MTAFPYYNALWLEVGCGKGRFTAETAQLNPQALLVAMERVPEAIVVGMERVCEKNLKNALFIDGDVVCLPLVFGENEVDRIFINFCDPWPKKRDTKRRLTSPDFLHLYEQILKKDGEIHFKTDNVPLFEYSLETFKDEGWNLSEVTRDLHQNGPVGVMTDYEAKFFEQGIRINRLVARKDSNQ